jgi:transcriptional regulator with XRE-family HTH domain
VCAMLEPTGLPTPEYGYSKMLNRYMESRHLSVPELARAVGRSKEHIRKLTNSEAFPSSDLAKKLADALKMEEPEEFLDLLVRDRWEKRHGKLPGPVPPSRVGPLEQLWPELSHKEQQLLLCVAECCLRRRSV